MLFHIIMREFRHNILSLRLHLSLILTIIVFSFGTVAFVNNHKLETASFRRYSEKETANLRAMAESNLTQMAVQRKSHILEPRGNTFINDSREKYLPGSFEYNAYNVFGFTVKPGSMNPYLQPFLELNWTFVISIIMGFTVFLFTFDFISGEKESRTLAISLANSVSRATLLFGKYVSAIVTTFFILVPGLCISLIIIFVSGSVLVNTALALEIAGFLVIGSAFIACIAAFGMLASVLTKSANVSLLITLTFWLVFVTVVPNTALFWAQTFFGIESPESVSKRISGESQEINNNAPEGSWSSNSDNPFFYRHELRANNQTNLMNSEKRIRDAYYLDMFNQLKRVRLVTLLSPVSLFEYMSDAVVGGGYVRFMKNWNDLHAYQGRFLTYFKDKDSADPDSPHWYNPYEDYSTTRKPVNFEEVPIYTERTITPGERFSALSMYLTVMMLYTVVIFLLSFGLFVRYDVR